MSLGPLPSEPSHTRPVLFSVGILYMGVPKIRGTILGGLHNKDNSILGSILGPLILGNYQICIHIYTDKGSWGWRFGI